MQELPQNYVDLIFADPPYFMQTEGILKRNDGSKFIGVEDSWDKFKNYEEYDKFTTSWLKECKRVLKPNGTIWVIGSFQNIYRLGYIMQNLGFWILNDIIWSKPNAVPNFSGSRFQNSHETLLWCAKSKNSKYTFNYKTMKFLNNNKQEKSVWNIKICTGNERLKDKNGQKIHSTQKPQNLLYNIIISSTKPNDIILDPFFGTGTTGAVAKALGRNFIGIEMQKSYIKQAQIRINNIKIATDEISNLTLEKKPPRVAIKTLLQANFLSVGQKLYNKDKSKVVILNKNGFVSDGKDELSIHKMSAKFQGCINYNGWTYFYLENDKKEFISLDSLRYKFSSAK